MLVFKGLVPLFFSSIMRIRLGSIVSSVSGKLAGHYARSARSGAVIASSPVRSDPRSPSQALQRIRSSQVASSWRSLSDADRLSWLKSGHQGKSGFALYRSLNQVRQQLGLSLLIAMPAIEAPRYRIVVSAVAVSSTNQFRLVLDANNGTRNYIVRAAISTLPLSGRLVARSRVVLSDTVPPTATLVPMYAALFAVYGQPAAGRYMNWHITWVDADTGVSGYTQYGSIIISS